MLTATELSRSFGKHVAVADAQIALPPGRVCGLVGPNGAGKTTFLLLLAGLLQPDSGAVALGGEPASSRTLRRSIGWMPDVFGTWESLTAREILVTFGRLYDLPKADARQRADELLRLVHLDDHADRPAHELSRGQKQRVGFARALVHRPGTLLLDEPASGMDPRSRIELRERLRELADAGTAILVSSHILGELEEMVDDVVMMDAGRTLDPAPTAGHTWRLRAPGESTSGASLLSFDDDEAAADHLASVIESGGRVAEFTRTGNDLEDAYLALDPVRR